MAVSGARLKIADVRLIDGTHRTTRHGHIDKTKALAKQNSKFGKPKMPGHLGEVGREAWKDYIEPAEWLTKARQVTAICFCELYEEFRDNPRIFSAGKHAQLRAYMAELGLTDERNRIINESQEAEATDEHFGD